jgi:diguanylate cyclase (GGDEF)-like protein
VLETPDPQLVHAGAHGELLVAKVRALLVLFVLYIPLVHLALQPRALGPRLGLLLAGVALVQTLLVYRVLRRHRHRYLFWLSCASSVLDVTLVSAALATPLVAGRSGGAAMTAAFGIYPLAIFATALRYDARICVVAGLAAVAEYTALAAAAAAGPGLAAAAIAAGWIDASARVILLVAATVLAAALVVRGRELRHLSTRDPLTGVLNRGFFDERVAEESGRLERGGEPVLCAMLDIDHFKRFNDDHGHPAGDAALRAIGRILGTSFRATDIVARYGGEEFAVVVPGLDPALAAERMEEIRRLVGAIPADLPGGLLSVTVSIGFATFPAHGATIAEVLAAADRRLYEAKRAGRNRVVGG